MSKILNNLIEQLTKLPGIGWKSAQRICFFILKAKKSEIDELIHAIQLAKSKLSFCPICFNYTENYMCEICSDNKRNHTQLCIVEDASDIISIERSAIFKGLYHVLGGVLSPIDNIGPEKLRIKELIERINKNKIQEIIIATNPTREGEATAYYLLKLLKQYNIKITRIAKGLPIGSDLDLADEMTISEAFEGRQEL